jgi:hypothetical protein
MVTHIVKTTIDIADALFEQVQRQAQKDKTTFRAIAEEGLRLALNKRTERRKKKLPPLLSFGDPKGKPLMDLSNWDLMRDEIYKDHGA